MSESERLNVAILADWVEGRLDATKAAQIAGAVAASDTHVQETVAWLRRFVAATRSLPLYQPPPMVAQKLRQHFTRWTKARAVLSQVSIAYAARPLFDSRLDLAPLGLRLADDSDTTLHLAFTTDVADLVLDVHAVGAETVRIDGQVLPVEPVEACIFEASVHGCGLTVRTVDGDELGRFSLSEVPHQTSELRVSNGEITIVAGLDLLNLREPL